MNLAYVLIAVLAVVLVIAMQLRPAPLNPRRMAVLPVAMALFGLARGDLLDFQHLALSATLLAAGLVISAATGLWRANTTIVELGPDGRVWARGTTALAVAWVATIVGRGGVIGLSYWLGAPQSTGDLLVALGLTLAVQNWLVYSRARQLTGAASVMAGR